MNSNRGDGGGWSPYIAGSLSGLAIIVSVLWTGKFFGASTSFVRSAGLLGKVFDPEKVAQLEYFIRYVPKFDWQLLFVVGIFLGSLLAALTSDTFKWQGVPDMWAERFGASPVLRGIAAFIGGIVAMFGARLAGGCPSGHGLSGISQLAASGLITLVFFFVGGIIMTRLLYQGGKGK